ncbi:type II secretion system secretin GspD [Pulveribacter sp.]|uniref:type II secretion system secretin GspD n=1 Tax=Pulveribacter sp. TaxID=2678893 RepID=UPI0028A81B72|nr:type II secretion system secretin GspD [Pulveribacter sp.]
MNLCKKHAIPFALALLYQAASAQPATLQAPAGVPRVSTPKAELPATAQDEATPSSSEPRILRGNDRVVAPAKPVAPLTGAPITFSFEEAPIAEVVRTILGDLLRVDYALYPPLNGAVTLATRSPVPPDQAVFLLESALAVHGLAMVRDARGSYHVGKADALKGVSSGIRQVSAAPLPPGTGPILVPLQYIGASEMAAILRPLLPADSLIRVDTVRNLLVLAGTRSQAEGWLEFVSTFDVDLLKGMSVGVFPLKYVSATEVESALRLIAGGGSAATAAAASARPGTASATRSATAAAPAAATAQAPATLGEGNPLFGALRVMPIERINSILVVTPRAAYLDEARRWIERFDRPSDGGAEPQLHIYQVQNGNARHLASVLQGIFGGTPTGGTVANSGVAPGMITATGTTGGYPIGGIGAGLQGGGLQASPFSARGFGSQGGLGGVQQGFNSGGGNSLLGNRVQQNVQQQQPISASFGDVRVMSDDLNNSVLIWSTRAEYEKIAATLKRLDLPPTQVLIEASIVEVTLNDNLQYGLQWAFNDSRANTGFTGTGLLTSNNTTPGAFALPTAGFSYTLRNPAGTVRAILSALSAKTSVRVVASPSLMVLDNHSAAIVVGTQTPIQSGTTSNLEGTVTTTNIQYKDTGVNLMVTPSVNAGNIVTMQVDQSVTDVGAADEVTKQRAFLQRQLSSKVAVRSGESIVMGGLIQERGNTTKSGVPILHTLPLVGNLFGTTGNEGVRTELLVVITPRVVRSDIDIREVSEDLRDRMKGLVPALESSNIPFKPEPAPVPLAAPSALQPLPSQ